MDVSTNLQGRLRNTSLPVTHGLSPVFEAVVNSIHALEEAGVASEVGRIRVRVDRGPAQQNLPVGAEPNRPERSPKGDIEGFTITDNGIGFDEENFRAFTTLDTDHKIAKGGRGIGRLLWLKAFDRVEVTSRYQVAGRLSERSFRFDAAGITGNQVRAGADNAERETTIQLIGFAPQYRLHARKTGDAIANAMLEHCLWYFVRPGGAPTIVLDDDGERISLDELFEQHMHSSAETERLLLKETRFDLLHVKLRASASTAHSVAYCADNRLVLEERLAGRIPGLHGKLGDEAGEFVYICYVSSPLLDSRVRPERNAFDLPSDAGELFEGTEISWEDIRRTVAQSAARHLESYLAGVRERARDRVHNFVARQAPRYRPILSRLSVDALNIDPGISDKDLELTLHKELAELESQLLREGHELMVPKLNESLSDYRVRLQAYLKTAEDIKRSDLANYVAHRRVVIDLLATAIQRQEGGGYVREDVIHTLIMPMRTESGDVSVEDANLWLIDERLAFHDYLASDRPLAAIPVTGSEETKEPDLFALNVFDNPLLVAEGQSLPLASIVVVEMKRPMRNDAGSGEVDDPIEQALGYLDRIREGKVRTATGRPIPRSEDIPGFCYVICDLTPSMERRCKMHDLTRTADGMGYFAYKRSLKAYVEVTSFDRLVNAATERNRAFFDKLGLPTK